MNRTLVASILGLTVSTLGAYGQASVLFDNYISNAGQVMWTTDVSKAPVGRAGTPVMAADGFKVNLEWLTGSYHGDALLAVPVGDDGYFSGPAVILLGYVHPSPITFEVLAWNGADFANSTANGTVTWTEPMLDPYPAGELHMPNLYVEMVPEPSLLGLVGLGAGALLLGRGRRE